jgi:hypothetical protein
MHLFGHGWPPRLAVPDLPGPEKAKALAVPADHGDTLTMKRLDCQSLQTAHSQAHNNRSAGVSLGRLTERC